MDVSSSLWWWCGALSDGDDGAADVELVLDPAVGQRDLGQRVDLVDDGPDAVLRDELPEPVTGRVGGDADAEDPLAVRVEPAQVEADLSTELGARAGDSACWAQGVDGQFPQCG